MRPAVLPLVALLAALTLAPASAETLFQSQRITPNEYKGIEGPAVDVDGRLYVVNFQRRGTIGVLAPNAKRSELFAELPAGSIGNGIRFARDGRMLVADYKLHNVLVLAKGSRTAKPWFNSKEFTQPNDLVVADDGAVYASDPNFGARTGRVWRMVQDSDGKVSGVPVDLGRKPGVTNGIELSPDGRTLYVGESNTREIWAYRIDGAKLVDARRVIAFPDAGELDGIRTDIDGRIFVARQAVGDIAVVMPDGKPVMKVPLTGKNPSNLAFGGADGRTVFVTQTDGGYIDSFRTDRPGREFCRDRKC